ncbi:hypothetical protein O0I10_003263 [Lichtheimia ornata]|uniref:Uncharacterized protein n=1 Tax=Lichtheimia ornata TaxID=688661 RepID=A0AAD7Y188_9FUNG|nr:uncharacterized protein O0I10_003263 [Lichtheimia ornata]KAJ8661041.1 hypothetical protein O0I10_003263 [Lichtheimia ornata]
MDQDIRNKGKCELGLRWRRKHERGTYWVLSNKDQDDHEKDKGCLLAVTAAQGQNVMGHKEDLIHTMCLTQHPLQMVDAAVIKTFVQEVITKRRSIRQQRHLEEDHPIWSTFSHQHYALFNSLIQSPLTFSPTSHATALKKVNDQSTPTDDGDAATFYIRMASGDSADIESCVQRYSKAFPADVEWCTTLLDHIDNLKNTNCKITLLYAGITLASTAFERHASDERVGGGTRMLNWVTTNGALTWSMYELCNLRLDNSSTVLELGYIEDIIIKSIGDVALNSANGGFFIDYTPSVDYRQLWKKVASDIGYPKDIASCPLSQQTTEQLDNHYNDLVDFMKRTAKDGLTIMPAPSKALINTLKRQSITNASVAGDTVNVMMGKDITFKVMKAEEYGFFEAGEICNASHFMTSMFDMLHTILDAPTSRDLLPPFVDLHSIHPNQPLVPSILYASRYLKVVKPIIITAMSAKVYTFFQLDAFDPLWSNQEARDRFFSDLSSPDNYDDMTAMVDVEHPSTAFYRSYGSRIGDLSIVRYGAGATDFALLLPIRDPGALKYDPRSQVIKCNEIFLSLCAMQVLEMVVRKKFNDSTRPSDATKLIDWMCDIRLDYNNTISKLGIKEELDKVKKSIKDLDQQQGSSRMTSSAERKKKASKEVDLMEENQPPTKSIITMRFIGGPDSVERQHQYDQLQAQHESRKKRFISINDTPTPAGMQPFTDEYLAWFMKGSAGKSIFKSANAMGNNPMTGLNEDEREEYLRKRRFGVYSDRADRDKNAIALIKDMGQKLGDFQKWMAMDKLPIMARCPSCEQRFIKLHNTVHHCSILDQNITSQQHGLQYFRILYLHDIFEALHLDEHMEIQQHDAAIILNQHQHQNISDRVPGSLGMVYGTVDTSDDFLLLMAVDKSIINDGRGRGDPPNNLSNDAWFFDSRELMNGMITHFNDNPVKQLSEVSCAVIEPCEYYSIRYPYRKGANSPVQHKHNRKNSKCNFGVTYTSFNHLPCIVRRYLWMSYRKGKINRNPMTWEFQAQ